VKQQEYLEKLGEVAEFKFGEDGVVILQEVKRQQGCERDVNKTGCPRNIRYANHSIPERGRVLVDTCKTCKALFINKQPWLMAHEYKTNNPTHYTNSEIKKRDK